MAKKQKFFDYSLIFILVFLLAYGFVMLYSTSSYTAQLKYGDSTYFLFKQIKALAVGIVLMLFATFVPLRLVKRLFFVVYLGSFFLCLAVMFFGTELNGSKRWLSIGSLSFQPSETAKIAIIIFIAAIISRYGSRINSFKMVIRILITLIPIVGIIAHQNLSTAIIVSGIAFVMLFVANRKYWPFITIAVGGLVLGTIGILLVGSYRLERIQVWRDPASSAKGFQTLQGLYAIGSGGLFGKGLGESIQKTGFLPVAQNDMIFSIICEELGICGGVFLILLFIYLLWRMMNVATNASNLFDSYLVIGVMAHIGIQVVLNIAVVTNTIPNTGVTLPFVSYGGTALMMLMVEMGIVFNVSRNTKIKVE